MSARPDPKKIADYFRGLGHENRIELLSILRTPQPLQKILLRPGATRAASRPERPLSRQSVQQHLDVLVEMGLVRVLPARKGQASAVHEYASDHARLFQILEEVRILTNLPSSQDLALSDTASLAAGAPRERQTGPMMVIAHGVQEGRAYPLRRSDLKAGRGWIIGRRSNAHVPLGYDPFVSAENTEIIEEGGKFRVLDLRSARNGTWVNWERLPIGGSVPLRPGDVLGVGRSLLVFREAENGSRG